jgi:hypothetical protein
MGKRKNTDAGEAEEEEEEEDKDDDCGDASDDEERGNGTDATAASAAATKRGADDINTAAQTTPATTFLDESNFDRDEDRERFKKGTLKREAYEMLEKAWPEMRDTNELWEQGLSEGRCLGKSKEVLASGMSHDVTFVRVKPKSGKIVNKWTLRCFVGMEVKAKSTANNGGAGTGSGGKKSSGLGSSAKAKVRSNLTIDANASSNELIQKIAALVKTSSLSSVSGQKKTSDNDHVNDENNQKEESEEKMKAVMKAGQNRISRATRDLSKAKERVEHWKSTLKELKKAEADAKNPSKKQKIQKLKTPQQFMKEAECPSEALPKKFVRFTGDKNDRNALSKWRKGKETAEQTIRLARDAYVEKRRREMREAKPLKIDPKKMKSQVTNATLQIEKGQTHVSACEDVCKALKLRKQIIIAEVDLDDFDHIGKLQEFEKIFLHIERAKCESAETVPDREKLKKLARNEAEEERVRIGEEKLRVKKFQTEAKVQDLAKAKADKEAAKEAERLQKIKEARYPIDDDELKKELEAEAKEKGIELSSLIRPLPKLTAVENGQILADEGALAEFLAIFSEALGAPTLKTYKEVRECLESEDKASLYVLYRALLNGALSESASGEGRGVARLRRVNDNIVWPQVIVKLLSLGGEAAHGKLAMEIVNDLATNGAQINLLTIQQHLMLLRALADIALNCDPCHDEMNARIQQAAVYKSERFEENAKRSKLQKMRDEKEKEKKRLQREEALAKKAQLQELQRIAREAGTDIPQKLYEDDDNGDDDDEDLDAKFALPDEFQKYTGDEMDRQAFLEWKSNRDEAQRNIDNDRRAYEAELLKRERDRKRLERIERMNGPDGDAVRERRWQETLERYQAEDDMVRVRVRALGRDRNMSTYWFGVGGRTDAVYVQSFGGSWGCYNTQEQIDSLIVSLNSKGERELGLLTHLKKKSDIIEEAFERIASKKKFEEEEKNRIAAIEFERLEREKAGARPVRQKKVETKAEAPQELVLSPGTKRATNKDKKLEMGFEKEFQLAYQAFDGYHTNISARKIVGSVLIEVSDIPDKIGKDIDWKTRKSEFTRISRNESELAKELLFIEEKLHEYEKEQFALDEEQQEFTNPAPPELNKARLEQLVLKHLNRDMRSWKLARSKLAKMLPEDVLNDAIEQRRREIIADLANGKEEKSVSEEALREKMFGEKDRENEQLKDEFDEDHTIWKHPGYDERRENWRATLEGKRGKLSNSLIAFSGKTFLDTLTVFISKTKERLSAEAAANEVEEVRADEGEDEEQVDEEAEAMETGLTS